MNVSRIVLMAGLLVASVASVSSARPAPLSSAFTYQGRLKNGAALVNNTADFRFNLWDASVGGLLIAGPVTVPNVSVSEGLFTVQVDFGVEVFNGDARWLAIEVRSPAGAGLYTPLLPRQPLTVAPYALQTRGIFVDANSNVGIGTTNPFTPLHVLLDASGNAGRFDCSDPTNAFATLLSTHAGGGPAILATNDGTGRAGDFRVFTGNSNDALRGLNQGTGSAGLFEITNTSSSAPALLAQTNAATGSAIHAIHSATTGVAPAILAETDSSGFQTSAVFGYATATTGNVFGVRGRSDSTSGWGVSGRATASSGTTYGVYGQSDSTEGIGVIGWGSNGSGSNHGGLFITASPDGIGVEGRHDNNGIAPGVLGVTDSSSGFAVGVLGRVTDTTPGGSSAAVRGENMGTAALGIGVWGSQDGSGWGVYGQAPDGIGVRGSGGTYGVYSVGDVCTTGQYLTCSDARLKNNVEPLTNALESILQMRGVRFDWNRERFPDQNFSGDRQIGFIAQEMAAILPEVVVEPKGPEDFASVSYERLVPVLVEAIKELNSVVDAKDAQTQQQARRIEAMETEARDLHRRIEQLEATLHDLLASPHSGIR